MSIDSSLICKALSNNDASEGISIINKVMQLDMNITKWNFFSNAYTLNSDILGVYKNNTELNAVICSYPHDITIDGSMYSSVFMGQTCSTESKRLQKKSPVIILFKWALDYHSKNNEIIFSSGLLGIRIYNLLYKNRIGGSISKSCFFAMNYSSVYEIASFFQNFLNSFLPTITMNIQRPIVIKFVDFKNLSKLIQITSNSCKSVLSADKIDFKLQGHMMALLKFLIYRKAKKSLIFAFLNRQVKIHGILRHPVKFIILLKLFYKIWNIKNA